MSNEAQERYMAARDMLRVAGINIDDLLVCSNDYSSICYRNAEIALNHKELAPLVTSTAELFMYKRMDGVNLADYDFSNVATVAGMFEGSIMSSVILGDSFYNVKAYSRMFKHARITHIGAHGLCTKYGEIFDSMFEDCIANKVSIASLELSNIRYRAGMFDSFKCVQLCVNEHFIMDYPFYTEWATYIGAKTLFVLGDNGKMIQIYTKKAFSEISLTTIRKAVQYALHDGTMSSAYYVEQIADKANVYSIDVDNEFI